MSQRFNARLRLVSAMILLQALFFNCSGGFKSAKRLQVSGSTDQSSTAPLTPAPQIPAVDPATQAEFEKNAAIILAESYLGDQQWHLNNTGQKSYASYAGTAGEDLHMEKTIVDKVTGNGVRIAISDSGVFMGHEAFGSNAVYSLSRNYFNDYNNTHSWSGDPNPDQSDPTNAHGTAVASLVAAAGGGFGIRGMAPGAKMGAFLFLPAQSVLSQRGLLSLAVNDQITGSNFDIFNLSWGYPTCTLINPSFNQASIDAIVSSASAQRGGKGSLIVKAGGNEFSTSVQRCYPQLSNYSVLGNAGYDSFSTTPYTIMVGAVNAAGVSAQYSSPGANLWVSSAGGEYGYSNQTATAPNAKGHPAMIAADFFGCSSGIKTLTKTQSAFNAGGAPNTNCHYTSTINGTSSAAPTLTGAIALMLEVNPNLSWRDVKYILAATADKSKLDETVIGEHPVSSSNLAGHQYEIGWITNAAGFHFHNYYGFGRVNVDKAVATSKNFVSPFKTFSSTNWANTSGAISLAIPDASAAGVTQTLSVNSGLTLEAVQIHVKTSACSGELGIEVYSPAGTKSIVMNINSGIPDGAIDHIFLSNAFYGEKPQGTWKVKVIDGKAGCTASLNQVRLNFFGY